MRPLAPRYISAAIPAARKARDEALVVGHVVAVEHGDDDRAGLCAAATIGLSIARNAASRREMPIEKPVAGTGSARKRATSPS